MNRSQNKVNGTSYDTMWPDLSLPKSKSQHKSNGSQNHCVASFFSNNRVNQSHDLYLDSSSKFNNMCIQSDREVLLQQQISADLLALRNCIEPPASKNDEHISVMRKKSVVEQNCSEIENFQDFYQISSTRKNSLSSTKLEESKYISKGHSVSINQELNESVSLAESTESEEKTSFKPKFKIAQKRFIEKQDRRTLKAIVSGVQVVKPDFSLEQAAEDFPALNNQKKNKKKACKNVCSKNDTDEPNSLSDANSSLLIAAQDKSWKPKTKDPICLNLGQALLSKSEKNKLPVKKPEWTVQKNYQTSNILDSGCPQQKRGKVRPDKPKRPSKLKGQIILERRERQKMFGNCDPSKSPVPDIEEGISSLYTGFDDELSLFVANCSFLGPVENHEISEKKIDVPVVHKTVVHVETVEPTNTLKTCFSRRFREYCTNCLTQYLTVSVCDLLDKVAQFQDRTFSQNPIKATAKRRYVAGISQTSRYLKLKKVKLLVIAPDLEKNPGGGCLDQKIKNFLEEAESQNIPCIFGPNRKLLGKAVFKNALVSCVAVLSYDGAEEQFSRVLEALSEAKDKFQKLTGYSPKTEVEEEVTVASPETPANSFEDITGSLLMKLKEEIAPADKL